MTRLDHPRQGEVVWEALIDAGPAALPALGYVLNRYDKAPDLCVRAASELGHWGEAAQGALPELRRLRDAATAHAELIAAALAAFRIGGDAEELLACCRKSMRSGYPPGIEAIHALGALGEAAAPALPDLLEAAGGTPWGMESRTRAVLEVLAGMGAEAESALPRIRAWARNVQYEDAATVALRRIEAALAK